MAQQFLLHCNLKEKKLHSANVWEADVRSYYQKYTWIVWNLKFRVCDPWSPSVNPAAPAESTSHPHKLHIINDHLLFLSHSIVFSYDSS
jgi:hypothetical protein